MKKMKWIAAILMGALLITALSGCGANQEKTTIGICQFAPHASSDAATKGFKEAVIAGLGEEKVEFLEQNAAGDTTVCTTIVNDFVSKNVDLILANSTAALQAAANATLEIPILGTPITDYAAALNLEGFNGIVGGNISGTSDLAPLDQQAQMIIDLVPTAKTVGLLYCSAEVNSTYQVKVVKNYLTKKGLTVKDFKFADSNDVAQVATYAAEQCDAIYIPTDNKAADCAETIYSVIGATKIPIVTGDTGTAKACGIATLSIDYYNIGKKTGEMAVKLLKGEAKIEEMPIEYDEAPKYLYNKAICDELGITVPEGYEELK